MNIKQSSEIRNALTIAKGRAYLARQRIARRQPAISIGLWLDSLDSDLASIDEAVNRVMVVVRELEREAGIGVVAATVPRP